MQLLSGQIPPSPRSDFVPTTLDRLGAEWLAQCRIEGKTPQTVRTYSETLRVLQQGIAAGILPADVALWTRRHLVSFFSWYSEHKHGGGQVALTTLQHRQRTVRAFLSWCVRAEVLNHNPLDGVRTVTAPQPIRPVLKRDDFQRLLLLLDHDAPARAARNRAILLLLYDCGPRLRELCSIQISDVLWQEQIIHIREGKGRKERYLPLRDTVYLALADYVRRFRPRVDGALFLTERGEPITPVAVNRMLWRLGERAGLSFRLSPHKLRHSFITSALDNGADLRWVQELAGHSDPKTTLRYARLRNMKLAAEAHKAFSPVERALSGKTPAVDYPGPRGPS